MNALSSLLKDWMRLTMQQKLRIVVVVWGVLTLANMALAPMRFAPRVTIEKIKKEPMALVVRAAGTLEAKASLSAKAQFDGPVVQKNFREGSSVKKGQLLAIIGRDRIRLDYQSKQDALANARADALRGRREVRLQQALFRKQAVALSAVEDAQRQSVRAEQALKSAEESFRLEKDRWNSAKVYAPLDGTIVKDGIGDNKFVQANMELVTVADISEYTAKVRVDELDIKSVSEGLPAEIRIPLFPSTIFPGRVVQIGSTIDGGGLSEIAVTIKILSTQGQLLRPRLTVEARIMTGRTEPTLSVPKASIANADGESRVWVVDGLGRLRLRPVELGTNSSDRVQIVKGLHERDRICAEAEPDWKEGMKVIVASGKAGAGRSRTQALISKEKNSGRNPAPSSGVQMDGRKRNAN